MPVRFDQMNAKISNYQNNGPLNALVHIIVDKMATMPDDPLQDGSDIKAELLAAFEAEWGTTLGADAWERLQAILQDIKDPMYREVLLSPVLRGMLPHEENLPQLSDESVAGLAKRFGIRAEFYEDFAGMKARIKERLVVERPTLSPAELEKLVCQQFKADLEAEGTLRGLVENDPLNGGLDAAQMEAKVQAEFKRIEDGLLPSYTREPVDTLPDGDHKLEENVAGHLATLRVYRKGGEYRFGASNPGNHENVSSIDTATHNYNSYRSNPTYDETAPRLKPLLQSAVRQAILERPEGSPVDEEALAENVSKIFGKGHESSKAKADQKGPLGGMMDGLLGNVETFFSKDTFGGIKGMMGIFETLLGPIMKMILGFQEAITEMNKKPGDPLTKKDFEKDPALREAAESFAAWIESLGENSSSAKRLNQAWRAHANATDVWVELVEAFVEDGQLSEADTCLRAQEKRLLESLEALKKEAEAARQDEHARIIRGRIAEYRMAIDPLETNTEVRKDKESIEARLGLFKEMNARTQEFSKTHQALKEARQREQVLGAEQGVLRAEQVAAGAAAAGFQERLARLRAELEANQDKVQELNRSEEALLRHAPRALNMQFRRCMKVRDQLQGKAAQAQQQARGRTRTRSEPPTPKRTN